METPIFSQSALSERRQRCARSLLTVLQPGEAVLIPSGSPVTKPGGLDQTYPFLPLPEYFWLSGSRRSGEAILFTQDEGWKLFRRPVSRDEMIWEGEIEFAQEDLDIADLKSWVQKKNLRTIYHIPTYGLQELIGDLLPSRVAAPHLVEAINQCRRKKDEEEIQLIRKCASAAASGYSLLKELVQVGVSEKSLQIAYEAEVLRAGAEKFPYDSIFGAGPRSAILHAIPTQRKLQNGEILLVDAGADILDYCVDITRTFVVGGKPTAQQIEVMNWVQKAHDEAEGAMKPGVPWREIHAKAAQVIAEGLSHLKLIHCRPQEALEKEVVSLFFPHGVGHMVGHRVRDVGGNPTKSPDKVFGARLRVNIDLEENHLMTVEPGLYFIRPLLESAEVRSKFKSQVNWSEVDKWIDFGGIRLENDILVKSSGCENLTKEIPQRFF